MNFFPRFIIALGLAFSAHAAAKAEFVKFSDLNPKAQKEYTKANSAKFKIKVSNGSRCTGTYISNEGHGLTAAHCITKCMPANYDLRHWPVDALITTKEGVTKQSKHKVTAYPWTYPQVCEAVIDGQNTQIEVIAGTKGRMAEHLPINTVYYFKQYYWITQGEVDGYKSKWLQAFNSGWGMGGDFAIFKVIKESPVATDCLKISDSQEFSGEHYSLSYPGRISVASKEINTDLYLSVGDVSQGNYFSSEVIAVLDESYRYLNSNLWAFPGSSGASLVNPKDHSISGVLSAVVGREGMSGDELPDARFISSKLIKEQAGEILDKISCD